MKSKSEKGKNEKKVKGSAPSKSPAKSKKTYDEEEEDKRAWDILHSLDKKQFKSQSKFVVLAILDYYEKCMKQEQDPYFETREKEDAFSLFSRKHFLVVLSYMLI